MHTSNLFYPFFSAKHYKYLKSSIMVLSDISLALILLSFIQGSMIIWCLSVTSFFIWHRSRFIYNIEPITKLSIQLEEICQWLWSKAIKARLKWSKFIFKSGQSLTISNSKSMVNLMKTKSPQQNVNGTIEGSR